MKNTTQPKRHRRPYVHSKRRADCIENIDYDWSQVGEQTRDFLAAGYEYRMHMRSIRRAAQAAADAQPATCNLQPANLHAGED